MQEAKPTPKPGSKIHTCRFHGGEYKGKLTIVDEVVSENAELSFFTVCDTHGRVYEIFWDNSMQEWKERYK